VPIRAVRGATQLEVDEREHLLERVAELVKEVLHSNDLADDDLISAVFTATPDIHAEFPAYAARLMGMSDVPLLCAQELDIAGAMPRVIRLMAHVETDLRRDEITHVYLHGAAALRRDLTQVHAVPDESAH
jgi:chorismate mutase